MRVIRHLSFILGVCAFACSKDPEGPPPEGAIPAAGEPIAIRASSSRTSPPATGKPRVKAHANPASEAVGVLPEGVGLSVGTRAPDLTFTDSTGATIHLASLYEKGDVLLAFYRGGWDPFSNHQIQAYVEHHAELVRRGLTVVFVSADRSENVEATRKNFDVPFAMVGDPTLEIHRAFAVHTLVPPEIAERMKARNMDIEAASGQAHHMLAVPSVFWIDRGGIIRLAHAEENHRIRPSPLQIATKIDGLREGSPPPSSN